MLKVGVSNFRNAWESMDPESERVDEYGLGVRESLAEAVSAVISILGMQPCEVSLLHHSFSYRMNAMAHGHIIISRFVINLLKKLYSGFYLVERNCRI